MRKPRSSKINPDSRVDNNNPFFEVHDQDQLKFLTRTDSDSSLLKIISVITVGAALTWVGSALVFSNHPLRTGFNKIVAANPTSDKTKTRLTL